MRRMLTLLRGTGIGLALALAFLPALVLSEIVVVSPGPVTDVTATGGSTWGGLEQVLTQQAADDDDRPGWVWAVVGGSSGAVIAAALGYKLWLGRRRD